MERNDENMPAPKAVPDNTNWFAEWTDNLWGMIASPVKTLERLANRPDDPADLSGAILLVILVFALNGWKGAQGQSEWLLLFSLPLAVGFGVITWVSLAAILGFITSCLAHGQSRVKSCLITTGWAFVPWLFIPPLTIYKNAAGPALGPAILLPILWMAALQVVAVQKAYRLEFWKALCLLSALPGFIALTQAVWFSQVFMTVLAYVLP